MAWDSVSKHQIGLRIDQNPQHLADAAILAYTQQEFDPELAKPGGYFKSLVEDNSGALNGDPKENGNAGAIIELPKDDLSADAYSKYARSLMQEDQFKAIEPRLALDYLAENYNKIHDKDRSDKLTAQEIESFRKNCIEGDPIKDELLKWVLHSAIGSDGQQQVRLDKLASIAGESGGITSQGLSIAKKQVEQEVSFEDLLVKSAPNQGNGRVVFDPRLFDDARFLLGHAPALKTPANPDGVTRFALDAMAYSASVPEGDRQSASQAQFDFDRLKKLLAANSDLLPFKDLQVALNAEKRFEDHLTEFNRQGQQTRKFWIDNE